MLILYHARAHFVLYSRLCTHAYTRAHGLLIATVPKHLTARPDSECSGYLADSHIQPVSGKLTINLNHQVQYMPKVMQTRVAV